MPSPLRSLYHYLFAVLGAVWYRFPSRKLFVIGVTGTKGKSTTVELIRAILEASGERVSLISSVHRTIAGKEAPNLTGNSMPGRFELQRFLREAVSAKSKYAIIEVTSQGVVQHRHRAINWDMAVFLNLSPEHVEAHGSFEAYREAKLEFFRSLRRSSKRKRYFVVNGADRNAEFFERVAHGVPFGRITLFSVESFAAKFGDSAFAANSWLSAPFNIENAAAAAAAAGLLGVTPEIVTRALLGVDGVSGRFEHVAREPFSVVVDYAHTPDSQEALYSALRASLAPGRKLIGVFGAASGGRDVWKRPAMGKIAAEYCDAVVLTNEDPFDEDPELILTEIEKGFEVASVRRLAHERIWKVLDRREAIRKALTLAEPGDVVALTGKGTETSIRMAKGSTIPWNEKAVAEEELARIR